MPFDGSGCRGYKKPPEGGFSRSRKPCGFQDRLAPTGSALASLEARVRLADHEDLAATAHNLAVTMTGLRRLQGGQDFHGIPRRITVGDLRSAAADMQIDARQARHSTGPIHAGSSGCVAEVCGEGGPGARMPASPFQIQAFRMSQLAPVLTIDGPSGAGKGTVSRIVAARLGWHYLDSGALYRAVGVAASWADIDTSDASALVRCTFDTRVQFVEQGENLRVIVNGTDATDELRLETSGALASAVAAIPEVRAALKERQRAFR